MINYSVKFTTLHFSKPRNHITYNGLAEDRRLGRVPCLPHNLNRSTLVNSHAYFSEDRKQRFVVFTISKPVPLQFISVGIFSAKPS